jgi:type VI secretion system protein ImpM
MRIPLFFEATPQNAEPDRCAMPPTSPQPVAYEQQKPLHTHHGPQTALPGWFGKLPGMGDFAHRRLPASFREDWDRWLQDGLAGLRVRHADDWTARYLESPLWCFTLGPGTVDTNAWIGVLMPSVDGVGRYFPFALAREFDTRLDVCAWWTHAARTTLEALNTDLGAEGFETLLTRHFAQADAAGQNALPPAGQSLWRAELEDGTDLRLAFAGLPRGVQFDTLFGFAHDAGSQPQELLP